MFMNQHRKIFVHFPMPCGLIKKYRSFKLARFQKCYIFKIIFTKQKSELHPSPHSVYTAKKLSGNFRTCSRNMHVFKSRNVTHNLYSVMKNVS